VAVSRPSWQDGAVRFRTPGFRSVCVASPTVEQKFFLAQPVALT
jgi:hypothetical protein